ncbi:hypothetical protein [Neorhizobium vignae]|uniref:hypothetical protein n=1 Tax=Neorhizobium vignae TaxID=690585 RepID=UPI000A6C7158|nr:hypothetical protein [Neorhizobium vignae]
MPNDLFSLIITCAIALVVLWLVFFVFRKLIGVVLLVALAVGVWIVWSDPAVLQQWADAVMDFVYRYL